MKLFLHLNQFRFFKIISALYRNLTIKEFFQTIFRSFTRKEKILIFQFDLSKMKSSNTFEASIIKGDNSHLLHETSRNDKIPWEYQCNEYDGVQDFFILLDEKEIKHISWIYYKNDPNRILSLKADEAEIKYCLTVEQCRGKGIYPKVLKTILMYLQARGFKKVFICANHKNTSSIRGITKAGFEYCGELYLMKFVGFQISKKYSSKEI